MATVEKTVCDVFGTANEIKRYHVIVGAAGHEPHEVDALIDLSPRGLARLKKFIERGLSKPSGKAGGNGH